MSAQNRIDPAEANISRLATYFQMGRDTVRRKIERAGIKASSTIGQTRYYMIADAAKACFGVDQSKDEDLVDPKLLRPSEQKDYWMAKQRELEYNREIGVFVHQDDVRATFRELAESINNKIQSYPDILERDEGLAPKEVDAMVKLCDMLSQVMHEAFVE